MLIFRGLPRHILSQPCALTIGNFDGVHLGHQTILRELKQVADCKSLVTCVLTFAPHPREYFSALSAPKRISTLRDKLAAFNALGIERVVILPFNQQLASMSAASFVTSILVDHLQTKFLLIGNDFRFGVERTGDFNFLTSMAEQAGYELAAMPSVEVQGIRVSSSALRLALAQGRLADAATLLGRPYSISGHVTHGAKLGRTLDVPTLNVAFQHPHPATQGIFVVRVFGLSDKSLRGVANFGTRPALDPKDVNGGRILLETYCLDWPNALGMDGGYGKIIRVELLHKLHDELTYDGLESLKAGIFSDIALASAYFLKNK